MNRLMIMVSLIVTFSVAGFARESQLVKATNVLDEIMEAPDRGIPHDLFEKAVCVGIVPSEIKGAVFVGEHTDAGCWCAACTETVRGGRLLCSHWGVEASDFKSAVRPPTSFSLSGMRRAHESSFRIASSWAGTFL